MTTDDLHPGEDIASWGARTGRFPVSDVPFWRAQLNAERGRVYASGGNPDTRASQVEGTIRSLYPALAVTAAAQPVGSTVDVTDEEYWALYPAERPRSVTASGDEDPNYSNVYGPQRRTGG